jgi:hypothetical protein
VTVTGHIRELANLVLILSVLISGLLSAWFWWRSSRASFVIAMPPLMITTRGSAILADDLEAYLREVGSLNAKAAMWGAVAVACSTAAGVLAALPAA